jgi:UDP-N-acetylmuramoyl-tripeptide--D-alanyl-D-alanine ligase
MAEFTVRDVVEATGGTVSGAQYLESFTGVSTDTRTIKPGNLFVALKGENFDGHNFLVQAVDNGAAGVVVSKQDVFVPDKAVSITVTDTLQALQSLARFNRLRYNVPVIAITGSNGKTTTKDMIAAILSVKMNVLKTEANYNNDIGLPLTLLKMGRHHQAAVVEMGMRARGEIKRLAGVAIPTIAVITNVGETHIEILGSLENIAAAKAELVQALSNDGVAILNNDIPLVRQMKELTTARVITYGLKNAAALRAKNIRTVEQQTLFDCIAPGATFTVTLPVVGTHNVYDALAAIAVGLQLDLSPDEICEGLRGFTPSGMRLHIEKIGDYTFINDAYNASPLSMNAAIETLGMLAQGRKVAILGDMLELGHVAVDAHRRVGQKLAAEGIQVVITVGELAKHIASSALKEGVDVTVACNSHNEAQEALRKLIRPGDTVLIKGSRGMKMETVLEMFKQ